MSDKVDLKRVTTNERRLNSKAKIGAYGYVGISEDGDEENAEPRKIDRIERKRILLNFVYDHSGEPVTYSYLAKAFAVSKRTIRNDVVELVKRGFIEVKVAKDADKKDVGHILTYKNGLVLELHEAEETIRDAHSNKNPLGLRDWFWHDYKIIVGVVDAYHTRQDKEENYAELKDHRTKIKRKATWHDKKRRDLMEKKKLEFQSKPSPELLPSRPKKKKS